MVATSTFLDYLPIHLYAECCEAVNDGYIVDFSLDHDYALYMHVDAKRHYIIGDYSMTPVKLKNLPGFIYLITTCEGIKGFLLEYFD